jgi:hypothetical protein
MKGKADMARTRHIMSINDKIEKAQADVVRTKAKHDASIDRLKQLMEKKAAMQKDALMNAIARSDKTYDEIMGFLKGDGGRE